MAVFLVTWNLNKEKSNYANARKIFLDHLARYQNVRDSALESVRWLSSPSSATDVEADLRSKLDSNDSIFVTKLTQGEHQGWLNKDVWAWINARL